MGKTADVEHPAVSSKRRRPRRWSRSERRWLIRFVCAASALAVSLWLVVVVSLLIYRDPPPWIVDVRGWRVLGRLRIAMLTLSIIQLILVWVLGLLAAVAGAAGFALRGTLRPRLIVQRRKLAAGVWMILSLRFALLMILLLAAIFTFTPLLGQPVDASSLERTLLVRPLLPLAAAGMLFIHLIAGPWLRLRYSLTLGALAAASTPSSARRRWSAITARLSAGLVGILALIWGSGAVTLAILTAFDPFYTNQRYQIIPGIFPHVPESIGQVLLTSLVIAVGLGVYTVGQIVLPGIYIRLAGRRARGAESR